jgi:ubiquinone/menaquinone biosynthesis C-methylase UbiE
MSEILDGATHYRGSPPAAPFKLAPPRLRTNVTDLGAPRITGCGASRICAMIETKLTAANNSAIQQWSNHPCGALAGYDEHSLAYFEAVERDRYESHAPWMRDFVNFASYGGQRVLEVGVGQGTDLVQFAKGGAEVSGIDITHRHLELAERNFAVRGLSANLQYATAADIPFEDDSFDVVYSFGVLHCTDNTVRSISECHRVLRPGGELILAMYHTYSFVHAYTIFVNGMLRGGLRRLGYKGLMSRIESGADGVKFMPLVKTYSRSQLRNILEDFSKVRFDIRHLTPDDFGALRRFIPESLAERAGKHVGWYVIARAIK